MGRTGLVAAGLACTLVVGCGGSERSPDSQKNALVTLHGRVRTADGSELEQVKVRSGERSTTTAADGSFELEVPAGGDRTVRVDSRVFSEAEQVVDADKGTDSSVDLRVVRRQVLEIEEAEKGGRFADDRGFALELPERALRTEEGDVARGPAEIRYTAIREPALTRVAPELRATTDEEDDVRLRSFGLLEVRFYQGRDRLELVETAGVEMRLPDGHSLREGERLAMYHYDSEGGRFLREPEVEAEVEGDLWRARLDRFSWWTAAEEVEELGCVRGTLAAPGGDGAANAVVHAVGVSELWLSSMETDADGGFCVEVPATGALALSAFWDDGDTRGEWSQVTEEATGAGSCGEPDCLNLGDLTLEALESSSGGAANDGGVGGNPDTMPEGGRDSGGTSGDGTGTDAGSGGLPPSFNGFTESLTASSAGVAVAFEFEALGNERIGFVVTNQDTATATARLYAPDGTRVSTWFPGADSTMFSDQVRLPNQAGTYVLEITPGQGNVGAYTVEAFGIAEDVTATPAVGGAAQTLEVTDRGQNAEFQLVDLAGQRLAFYVTNGSGSTATVRLRDAEGTNLQTWFPGSGVTLFSDAFTLPTADETYTLLVDLNGDDTGSVTLSLQGVAADMAETVLVGGDQTFTTTTAGQNGVFTFAGSIGDRRAFYITNGSQRTATVRLRDAAGSNRQTWFPGAGTTLFSDSFVLGGAGGPYEIFVDPAQDEVGTFEVRLRSVAADAAETILVGGDQAVTTTTAGQDGAFTFAGSVGDRLAFYITNGSPRTATIRLRDAAGSNQRTWFPGAGATLFSDSFVLGGAGGPYEIFVDPAQDEVGTFDASLFSVPADDGGPTVVLQDESTATAQFRNVSVAGQNATWTFTVPGASEQVSFEFNNDTTGTVRLRLLDSTQDVLDTWFPGSGSSTAQGPIALPMGDYTLEADPQSDHTGSMDLRVFATPPP